MKVKKGDSSDAVIDIGPCDGNATPAVVAAASRLRDGGTLRFAPGEYHFFEEGAKDLFLASPGSSTGPKKVAIHIEGRKDVTIDGGGADSAFTVLDWRGNEVRRGEWPADGRLELAPLPSGFYRVETGRDAPTARPQGGCFVETPLPEAVAPFDFCVVRRDPCRNPDSPFAVDSALSHRAETFDCPWYDGDTFRVVCELMRKCGIVQTRERMVWKGMNPEPGVFTYKRWLDNAEHLRESGLVTTGIFAGTPAHAGGEEPGRRQLPTDLMAPSTLMTNAVPTFGDAYNAWGFWNEPDLQMVPEPVWEYVAAFKAFALAVRAADPAKPVLLGALADVPDQDFGGCLAANEFPKYADIFNIHTYLEPARLPDWNRRLRAFLAQCGRPDWAVWQQNSKRTTARMRRPARPSSSGAFPRSTPPFRARCIRKGCWSGRSLWRCPGMRPPAASSASCEVVPLSLEDPACWRRNDSAQTYSCAYDNVEKAVRFDVSWTGETGPWFMPWHDLKLPEESLEGAKMLEFEVKSEQDKVENDYNSAVFMPTYADGHAANIHYPPPGFNWEVRRVALPPDAGGIVSFRLGGAPSGHRLTFWIRNVRLLR